MLWFLMFFGDPVLPFRYFDRLEDIPVQRVVSYCNGFEKTLVLTSNKGISAQLMIIEHRTQQSYESQDSRIRLVYPFCSVWSNPSGFWIVNAISGVAYRLNPDGHFEHAISWQEPLFGNSRQFRGMRAYPLENNTFLLEALQFESDNTFRCCLYKVHLEPLQQELLFMDPPSKLSRFVAPGPNDSYFMCFAKSGEIRQSSDGFQDWKTIRKPEPFSSISLKGRTTDLIRISVPIMQNETPNLLLYTRGDADSDFSFLELNASGTQTDISPLVLFEDTSQKIIFDPNEALFYRESKSP